jgi:hypothetical protein
MNPLETLTHGQKILLLRSRFKSTKDLWLYLTERRKFYRIVGLVIAHISLQHFLITIRIVGYLLPSLKECRLSFLQDIMKGTKRGKLAKDVPA